MTDKPHSPLPWRVSPHDGTYLLDANGREVCETGSYTTERDVMKADARLIVTAVNSHADLVAENKRLREALEDAEAALVYCGADIAVSGDDFVPTPTLALRNVRAALQGEQP